MKRAEVASGLKVNFGRTEVCMKVDIGRATAEMSSMEDKWKYYGSAVRIVARQQRDSGML